MPFPRLKSPKFYLPTALILLLGVATAVIFYPAFQKKMLQDHVGPLVDSLHIGYVHLTPWSLEMKDVTVQYQGGHFVIRHGLVRFDPFALLFHDVDIKSLVLKGARIDLAKFTLPPPPPVTQAAGPFPGVLALLRHGFGYRLGEMTVDAVIRLSGQRSIAARITGGGIKPEAKGTIGYQVRFDTGHLNDHIEVHGTLGLNQLRRGRFAAVETALAIRITLAALPQKEHANLKVVVTRAAEKNKISQPTAEAKKPYYTPEAVHLSLQLPDIVGKERCALHLKGIYNGNTGNINGNYRFTANQRLLAPYLKKITLPPATEALKGEFTFDSVSLTGNMTVKSDLAVQDIPKLHPHAGLPQTLQLKNNFRVSLLAGRKLLVQTLDSELLDSTGRRRLESSLTGKLHIALDNPTAFLHQKNSLLDFTLPGVPLAWFNVLVPDYDITAGTLAGTFEVATDRRAAIHLKPLKPLQIKGLTVLRQGKTLVKGFNLSVLPGVVYSGKALTASLKGLTANAGHGTLASADLGVDIGLAEPGRTNIAAQAEVKVDLHRLLNMLAIKHATTSLPRHLGLTYQAVLHQRSGRLRAERLDATVSLGKTTKLLQLHLLHPLVLETSPTLRLQGDTSGDLASLKCSDINLKWLAAFVPKMKLQGKLARAELTVATNGKGVATLTSSRPVDLRHVTLATEQKEMLDDLGIQLIPDVRFDQHATRIDYRNLEVTSHQEKLLSGGGQITLEAAPNHPLLTDGHLDADLQALSKQPLIVRALKAPVKTPLRLQADYRLARRDGAVDIDRLFASLFYDGPTPRLTLHADSKVHIPIRLGGKQSELARTTGKVTVTLAKFTPGPFAGILKARGLAFTRAQGKAELVSKGRTLTVNTIEPLMISDIAVRRNDATVLHPFTLTAKGKARMKGNILKATLEKGSLAFAGMRGVNALDAHGTFTLKGVGRAVTLESLKAGLSASLPQLLAQPAVLPGNHLTAGTLTASLEKDPDGKLRASALLTDLKADRPLALQSLSLAVAGNMTPDGGFTFSAPLGEKGKSGSSDIQVQAGYTPGGGNDKTLHVALKSSVFYLNDILSAVQTIGGRKSSPPKEQTGKSGKGKPAAALTEGSEPDLKPDAHAFWNTAGYALHLKFKLDRLFYTDYLEFRDIQGHAALLPDRLELDDFAAHFHNSPITLDGRITFKPGPKPYDLKLEAGVERFDLARFFRELVPGSTPRAAGLFDVDLDASGTSPNLAQYRNDLYFDMRLESQKGVFRPFDPNSPLVTGTSRFAGLIGESVSNLPTGLFGLGAAARLVNYIKVINYEWMVIHLVRGKSRDVQIKQYVVQSPQILMTATGGITYRPGVDIVNSPVSVVAHLDMLNHGAAILYSLGLLQSQKDNYGYWKGPVIKVWGDIAHTKTNLDEIISKAGRGAVLGGFTRPVSGLWGNLKLWWFGGGKNPPEVEKPAKK